MPHCNCPSLCKGGKDVSNRTYREHAKHQLSSAFNQFIATETVSKTINGGMDQKDEGERCIIEGECVLVIGDNEHEGGGNARALPKAWEEVATLRSRVHNVTKIHTQA